MLEIETWLQWAAASPADSSGDQLEAWHLRLPWNCPAGRLPHLFTQALPSASAAAAHAWLQWTWG